MIASVAENKDITPLSTMKLRARARYFTEPATVGELLYAVQKSTVNSIPFKVIGGGSNIYFKPIYEGAVIKSNITGRYKVMEDQETVIWEVYAGEEWDDLVSFFVESGLYGLENLSYIPGSVGACPVQNLNAYGCEVSDFIDSVKCLDLHSNEIVILSSGECEFEYRGSTFKYRNAGRYIIISVFFRMSKQFNPNLSYRALSGLDQNTLTPTELRKFIINLRKTRLPDVNTHATNGSFFINTLTDKDTYEYLINNTSYLSERKFDVDPIDKKSGKYKLITASLVRNSGAFGIEDQHFEFFYSPFEGSRHGNVIVHKSMKGDYNDLERFVGSVKECVYDKFGIEITQEPEAV
jgi:UDP-N-acetylmuramate dehydrogenase